ncbi:PD-(D/E)XK nuclease-like domain-containing protein [Brucella pseudintermedia]|uniref:PD-(D/E)XK nuclease-like domain-containing protein n=1 Tax=Brucella pseudintermedia TaxID=370111 RepID=UPI00124F273E|nr:PD-(D/E)XK nuclease-like domain-containing protein [Brucella pseudintermedia]KAB2680365.1 hypothetical protein F9K78_16895 [Brucella pseudintermedia]
MTDTLQHQDGIWFGLSDTDYHADKALGSTGLKKLVHSAPDFWFESWMNPHHEDNDTEAKVFGRRLHTCVLEGVDKFKSLYAPYMGKGNEKAGIAEIKAIKEAGKEPIKIKDYHKILLASLFIKKNRTLEKAFEGGLPEVSVFWTVDDIRYKARFDYLQTRSIVDLKSIDNQKGIEFTQACRNAIANYDYIVSAHHYSEGRRQMKRLLQEGLVFGLPAGMDGWLINVANFQSFAFVFVFWQKSAAPISHGIMISPDNPIYDRASEMIAKAVANYRRYMDEFGPDEPWVPTTQLDELYETDMPVWYQQKLIGA